MNQIYCYIKYKRYEKLFEPIKTVLQSLGYEIIMVDQRDKLPKDKSIFRFQDSVDIGMRLYIHADEKTIDDICNVRGHTTYKQNGKTITYDVETKEIAKTKGYDDIFNILKARFPELSSQEILYSFETQFYEDDPDPFLEFDRCIFGRKFKKITKNIIYGPDNFYTKLRYSYNMFVPKISESEFANYVANDIRNKLSFIQKKFLGRRPTEKKALKEKLNFFYT